MPAQRPWYRRVNFWYFLFPKQIKDPLWPVYYKQDIIKVLRVLFIPNWLVFLIMILNLVSPTAPSEADLLKYGALNGAAFHSGDYWRILTYNFIYDGAYHVVFWSIVTAFLFMSVNTYRKPYQLLIVYVISGMVAGGIGMLYAPGNLIVGGTGALMGVAGFAIVYLLRVNEKYTPKLVMLCVIAITAVGLAIPLLHIDLFTQIAGLATGVSLGFLFLPFWKSKSE